MFSPTGYFAHITVDSWLDRKLQHRYVDESRPVLHWNEDGEPVICNPWGELVTPDEYIAEMSKHDDDEAPGTTYLGSFEVHPFTQE